MTLAVILGKEPAAAIQPFSEDGDKNRIISVFGLPADTVVIRKCVIIERCFPAAVAENDVPIGKSHIVARFMRHFFHRIGQHIRGAVIAVGGYHLAGRTE